ncbi:hypothetical protein A4D02_21795 [Niastella koreensis]|uniref:Sulfatase N-terminal domain-containing protein n=2 Tax=Niastella koreensis TaxID=354356 RepID=G8THS4_NIAKG|nr:hypothetical protein [Niastella koreensis]AEV98519.1 hypothetical protein Niako_2164 [Niastella koreensis GR20-10]OQP53037.1 hypothetical protein A4D02_21795 [Niastella koreensis]
MNKRKSITFSIATINVLLFPVLLTAYFILHENNAYFGLIPLPFSLKIFFCYFLFIVFAAAFLMYVLKNQSKAFLYLILLTAILLFFGAAQDLIKTIPVTNFFKKYKFLLPFILLIAAGSFILFKRSKKDFSSVSKFIQLTISILVVWEVVLLLINLSSGKASENNLVQKAQKDSLSPASKTSKLPNIYFIVFDAFTSSRCLQEEFGYNPKELDSFLYKQGFYVVANSKSNYPVTFYSIGSTLNFSYLADSLYNQEVTAKDLLQGVSTVSQNRLIPYLEAKGYTIINHSLFDYNRHPALSHTLFHDLPGNVIVQQTLPGRISKDIMWNFTRSDKDHAAKLKFLQEYVYDKLNGLRSAAEEKVAGPKFVSCHLMLPHEPYLYNKDGTLKLDSPMFRPHTLKKDYLDQVIYTQRVVKDVIKTIFDKDTLNKIVIVEGDHGFRDYGDSSKIGRFFENLNAIYFYDKNYTALYNSMTPVNTFRVVLNQYFNEKLKYLPDTSIYIYANGFDDGRVRKN